MSGMYDLEKRFSDAESASEAEENSPQTKTVKAGSVGVNIGKQEAGAQEAGAQAPPEGGYKQYPTKEYTAEEKAQKLEGYLQVPQRLWCKLTKGAHVRYVKTVGTFKPGGFVSSYTIKDDGRKILQLNNSFNTKSANFITFPLDLSTVKAIYKKIPPNMFIEIEMIKQMLRTHDSEIIALKEENAKIKRLLTAATKR